LLLESSDPFHRTLSLVSPITDVPIQRSVLIQRSVPLGVPRRGGDFGSEARLRVTVRGVGPEDGGKLFV
jgi:hypothetical protein